MKKIVARLVCGCLCAVLLAVGMGGCGESARETAGKGEAAVPTGTSLSASATSEGAVPSLQRKKGLIRDERTELKLPHKYRGFSSLISLDDDYYYMEYGDDAKYWRYIAVGRESGEIVEYAPVDKKLDVKFTHGLNGAVYTATIGWDSDVDCKFKILKLGLDGSTETRFEADVLGVPDTMPHGDSVIMNIITEKEGRLLDYNLVTGETVTLMEYGAKMSDEGFLAGTRVSGLGWSTELPSSEGLCYGVSTSGKNPDEIFTFEVYYYSFTKKKSSRIHSLKGNVLDYIGGNSDAFFVKLPNDADSESDPDNFSNVYIKEKGGYSRYLIPDMTCGNMVGSGVLGKGKYIAYGEGAYFVDTEKKLYDGIKYHGGGAEIADGLDIVDDAQGCYFDGAALYFTAIDKDGKITLHKITGDSE
jgi:hypothetical protein